jgi:hypothetical protein
MFHHEVRWGTTYSGRHSTGRTLADDRGGPWAAAKIERARQRLNTDWQQGATPEIAPTQAMPDRHVHGWLPKWGRDEADYPSQKDDDGSMRRDGNMEAERSMIELKHFIYIS